MKEKYWSKEELSSFCLEFSMLLKSGISAGEGFSVLAENEENKDRKQFFIDLYEETIIGASVSGTMAACGVFPPYMLRMLEIGEMTGHLERVFASLSNYYDERLRMERLLKETVAFPIILFLMMLSVTVLLIMEVLPIFQNVFAQLGGTLPPIALFFLNIGDGLRRAKFVFLGLLVCILACIIWIVFLPGGRSKWGSFWQKRFSSSKVGYLSALGHFSSALYMTVSGGLDTDKAMEMAAVFCKDSGIYPNICKAREKAEEGMPLAEALESEKLLRPMYCRMLAIGIKTGNVDRSLEEIARRSEEDASGALLKAAAAVEPVVVISLSVMIGLLLLSVMFPLVGIMSSLG